MLELSFKFQTRYDEWKKQSNYIVLQISLYVYFKHVIFLKKIHIFLHDTIKFSVGFVCVCIIGRNKDRRVVDFFDVELKTDK